jgi:hypothetical protein
VAREKVVLVFSFPPLSGHDTRWDGWR